LYDNQIVTQKEGTQMSTQFKHHLSSAAKIKSGLCEEGRYIRIDQRGTAIVLFLSEAQAKTLSSELPHADA